MADSKNKRPSTSVRRTAPNSYWLNNAMKSIGMGLLDYAEEVIPNISYMTTTATKDAADYIRDQKKDNSALKLVANSIKNSEAIKDAKEVFKNALTDLRSGKFIGNDRESGDMFGFDDLNSAIDDLDNIDFSSFGDEDDVEEPALTVKNDNRVNVIDNSATKLAAPMVESVRKVGQAQLQATTALSSEIVEIGSKILFQSKRSSDLTIEKLSSIDSRLAAINDFNNNTMSKLAQSSIAYYERILKKEEDSTTSSNTPEDLYDGGKLNMKAYLGGMKDKFMNEVGRLGEGMVGLAMTAIPQAFAAIKDNPIEEILKGVLKNLTPAASTVAVKSLDKAFENFIPAMLTKLADYTYSGNNKTAGSFLEFIAHTLGRKDYINSTIRLDGVNKDAVQWDNRSRYTLVDIIPKYLSEISAYTRETSMAMTGKNRRELDDTSEVFNFSNGVYKTKDKLQSNFFGNLSSAATEAFNGSAFADELDAVLSSITDSNKKIDFNNILNQLKFSLTANKIDNNGKSIATVDTVNRKNDVLNMVDSFNADNETKSLLKAALLSLSDDARLSVSAAQQNAVRAYNSLLKEISENQADYRLADVYSDTTLNNEKVYEDVIKMNANKGAKSANVIRSQQNIRNSLGNSPIQIMGDIRAILLRGINVRLDRKTKSLYDAYIPSSVENVSGQPTYIQPIPQQNNTGSNTQQSNNPDEALLENTRKIIDAANEKEKESQISSASGMLGDDIEKIGNIAERNQRVSEKVEKFSNKGKAILYSLIYGNTNQLADEIAVSVTNKAMDVGTKAVNSFVTPIFNYVTQDDEATGRKSIATIMRNQIDDTTGSIQHYLFGKGYIKSDGTEVKELTGDDMKESVAGQLKTTLKTVTSGIKEYIFGKKEDSDDESQEENKGFINTVKEQTMKGFIDWRDLMFGDETENTPQARQEAIERVEKFAIKSIPNAALGSMAMTGVGMLAGNSLLGAALGGPIGAIAGAATGIAMSSDTFKERVFGKEDQTTGEWIEGVIPKSTQDWIKENSSTIAGGAAIGTIKTLVVGGSGGLLGSLVGGPLAGAVVGAGAAFVKKSESFQKFLYGEDIKDEQGNIIRHANGVLERIGLSNDAKINEKMKRMGLSGAIGGGLVGAIMLHPLIGASLGLAGGILSSNQKFQDLMFGKKGSDGKRDRNSSVFGRIFNFLNLGIFQPLAMSVKRLVKMVGHNVKYNILKPLGIAIQPLLSFVRKIGSGIKGITHTIISGITFPARWIGKKIWNSIFKGKIARLFGGAIRKITNIPRLLFSAGANMFKIPMYMLASGSSIGNTLGTIRRKTVGNVFNMDGIRESMTDENGEYKTGLAGIKGMAKGIGNNIRTGFNYMVNKDGMLTDAIVDENGGLARDTFRQMRENEKERVESRKRILEDYKYERASNIYQAALSGALGYTIAPNRYGAVDMNVFNDRLNEKAQKMADKYNRSFEAFFTGKRDVDYYKNELMKKINRQSKSAFKAMGVDNLEDFNAKMMARIDPTTGKSVAEIMSDRKVDPEERKYRDDMVKNFQDVNADTDSILEQLIQIRTNQLSQSTGGNPEDIASNLRKQMNQMRNIFDSTEGDVITKRAAVFGKFMGNNKKYTFGDTRLNTEDNNEVSSEGHAKGTKNAKKGIRVVGENGPELVRFSGGEEVVAANKIDQAMGKAYKTDLAIMRSKPNDLSIQERMLSAILTIRSTLIGLDPSRPFNFNAFQKNIRSSINKNKPHVSDNIKSTITNTATNMGNIVSSMSSFFDGPDINSVDDDYNDSEIIPNASHSSSLTDVLTNGGDSKDVAKALKDEESRKVAEARVKDVTSKSYQNLKEEEREQATKLAPVQMAETLNRMEGENTKQNSIWRSIFGKDSLIAGTLVIGVPLILKLVKKLLNLDLKSLLSDLGSSLLNGISTAGKSILAGLSSGFNFFKENYEEQTKHGDVNNDGEIISSAESAKDTAIDMISNTYNSAKSLLDGDIVESAGDLWQSAHGTKQYNNEITNTTDTYGKAVFGTVKNVANSKVGTGGAKLIDTLGTKLATSSQTGVIAKVKQLFASMFKAIAESAELKAKFGQGASAKVAQLAITIGGKFEKVANNKIVQKISQGFAAATAKVTAAAGSVVGLLLNNTVFALAGGVDRMTATAKLFKVSKDYAKDDIVMIFIAGVLGTMLSTSIGLYFDVIFSVLESAGIDLLGTIAVSLYNVIMTAQGESSKIEGLEAAQDEWRAKYDQYYAETVEKQANTHNMLYNTNYTAEEFVQAVENGEVETGVDYESFDDWNARENASFMTTTLNSAGTAFINAVSDDFEAYWTSDDGTKYTFVRNNKGTFDVYDEQGEPAGYTATLPEGAEMSTTTKDKYQNETVSDSIYGNKSYWSKDGKRYYVYNGKTFDEYNALTNKQSGLFHNGTMSVEQFNALAMTGDIDSNGREIPTNSILGKYGQGRMWVNKNGDIYMLDDQSYLSTLSEKWYIFSSSGELKAIVSPDDTNNLNNIHKAIDDGTMTLKSGTNLYSIDVDNTAAFNSNLGEQNVGSTGIDYLSTYLNNLSSSADIIGTSEEEHNTMIANESLIANNRKANDNLWDKYGGADYYDNTGYKYVLDSQLRAKTGGIAFMKYTSAGDFIKYISSGDKEFNKIVQAIDDGTITKDNPLDNTTIMKAKKISVDVNKMTNDELEDYVDGCNKAFKEGRLGELYSNGYNDVLMNDIDTENVGWFYPETGAYYIRTDLGFEAYNANGSLIGIINDVATIAKIYMQIETGMLVRGVPITSTINQGKTVVNSNIASAISANAVSASTGTVVGGTNSLVTGSDAVNAAISASGGVATDPISGNSTILSGNPSTGGISSESYLAAYEKMCESMAYSDATKRDAIRNLEKAANYDLDEDGTIGSATNLKGTAKGKSALATIGSSNIKINSDGTVEKVDNSKNNNTNINMTKNNTDTSKDTWSLASTPGGKGEDNSSESGTSDKVYGHAYLSQSDSKWKNESYDQSNGDKESKDRSDYTIGTRGCGPTVLAMVANDLTGSNLKPSDVSKDAERYGYSDQTGTNWSFMNDAASLYGISSSGIHKPDIKWLDASLSLGKPVIMSGLSDDINSPYTGAGHYVVVYGKTARGYQVADPRGKSSSKVYSSKELFDGANASWSFSKNNNHYVTKDAVKKLLLSKRADMSDNGGFGNAYLSKSQKQKLVDQMITWKANSNFRYNSQKDAPNKVTAYMTGKTGMTTEPLIVQLFSSALGINLLDSGISRRGQGLSCPVLKEVSPSDRQFGDICYIYSAKGSFGGVLSSSSEYVGFKDASQWGRINSVKLTTSLASKFKYYRYFGPAGLSATNDTNKNDTADTYNVDANAAAIGVGGGDPTAINSPYRGKFRMSQQFRGTKFPTQVDGDHDGYDLVGIDSKTLYSTIAGVVVKAGWENESNHSQGFGQYVKVEDSANPGTFYYYGHMSEIKVKQGDTVAYGTPIGTEGSTGHSTGPHCHYCIRSTTGDSKQNGCLDITTMSNIPNVRDTYEDNGTYGSQVATASVDPTTGAVTTVVQNQNIFDKISTGLSNIISKTWNGIATDDWDHDWTNILGNQSSTIVPTATGVNGTTTGAVSVAGDYIGKYVKQFESGDKGSACISTGQGDPKGGPSFGTFQFPSYWKTKQTDADGNLYNFWNKYYAASNPDVTPGNNDAFKARWKQLAEADPDGFFANEYAFCFPQYYLTARNNKKFVGTVNPDKHRSWQESFWSTAIQFGAYSDCWNKGHAGYDDNSDETQTIEHFQDYKGGRTTPNRHRGKEKELLLSIVGQQPIDYSSLVPAGTTNPLAGGGNGDGPTPNKGKILTSTPNIKGLLEKAGINNKAKPDQDYEGYHPQTGGSGEYEVTDAEKAPDSINGFAYYSQNDSRWADAEYKQTSGEDSGDPQYMSNRGCGPTVLAMAAKGLTGEDVNPMDTANVAEEYGYSDQTGTNWSFMNDVPSMYGISSTGVEKPSVNFVEDSLRTGRPVILSGYSDDTSTPYTKAGHYVLAVGEKNGRVKINDPRGKKYSKAYDAKTVADNASAAWSLDNFGRRKLISNKPHVSKSYKYGGKGYTTADFVAACSMACAELGRNNWSYSQSASRTYQINGKEVTSRSDCSGMVSAALIYLGILDSGWSSGDYDNESNSSKITSQLPMKFVKTSTFSSSDWDNLPPGTILCKGGYHVEVFMGWAGDRKNSIVYSGGSGPSKVGYRTAYGWKEGMVTVPPYESTWGGSSYRSWPSHAYVPTDGGAQYTGGTVVPANGSNTTSDVASSSGTSATSIGSIFDSISTGVTTISNKTWDGIATGEWDHDWSDILTGSTTTASVAQNTTTDTSSNDITYTAGQYPIQYPTDAPTYESDQKKNFMNIMIGNGAIQSGISGNILPSIKLGQAAYESGYATSSIFKNANNLYGIRKGALQTGTYQTSGNGSFASYDSPAQSIADHTRLLNNSNYGKTVPGAANYRAAAQAMVNAGYCSDSGYVNELSGIIESNNFDYFDKPEVMNFYKSLAPTTGSASGDRDKPLGGGKGGNSPIKRSTVIEKIGLSNPPMSVHSIDYSDKPVNNNGGNGSSSTTQEIKINNGNIEKVTGKILELLKQLVEIENEGNDKLDEININSQVSSGSSSIISVPNKTNAKQKIQNRSEVIARMLAKA